MGWAYLWVGSLQPNHRANPIYLPEKIFFSIFQCLIFVQTTASVGSHSNPTPPHPSPPPPSLTPPLPRRAAGSPARSPAGRARAPRDLLLRRRLRGLLLRHRPAPRSCAAALRGLLLARLAPRESAAAGGADEAPRAAGLHAVV